MGNLVRALPTIAAKSCYTRLHEYKVINTTLIIYLNKKQKFGFSKVAHKFWSLLFARLNLIREICWVYTYTLRYKT